MGINLSNKSKKISKSLIKNSFNNSILKSLRYIKAHYNFIKSMSVFPSGNIISVSCDQSIQIYDLNMEILQHIHNAHDKDIEFVDIKDEKNFVTCSYKNIKTWVKENNKFQLNKIINNAHDDWISKVIYYSNNKLISCSLDKTIKIWEENNNNYQTITILIHYKEICSILLLEDKNIFISTGYDGTKLWNLNNYEFIIHFQQTFCQSKNALCRIDKDKIIVQSGTLKVISIIKKQIIKEIYNPFSCWVIYSIKDKNIFIIGGNSKDIKIYRIDNYQYIETITNVDEKGILGFIQLKNKTLASYGCSNIIKIWSF